MEIMKKLLFALALVLPLGVRAQTYTYALPQTVISLEVTAENEQFHAGPYAKYAMKYLGVDARTTNGGSCRITEIRMTPLVEADPSRRLSVNTGAGKETFLSLSAQGLVAIGDGQTGRSSQWRFPSPSDADFADRGVSSNLTSEQTTLYRSVQNNTVAVQQDMVVTKSIEQRAREAADMIFSLRKKRVEIVTGDTDATFSGEAMAAAIQEISRMEKEYLSLFIGYSDVQVQKMKFDVVPSKTAKSQVYVAFRVSDQEGLVSADNVAGKPYLLELVPQPVAEADASRTAPKGTVAWYRVPAVCTVKLSDGVNLLLQDRVPVYQLGFEEAFPIGVK